MDLCATSWRLHVLVERDGTGVGMGVGGATKSGGTGPSDPHSCLKVGLSPAWLCLPVLGLLAR